METGSNLVSSPNRTPEEWRRMSQYNPSNSPVRADRLGLLKNYKFQHSVGENLTGVINCEITQARERTINKIKNLERDIESKSDRVRRRHSDLSFHNSNQEIEVQGSKTQKPKPDNFHRAEKPNFYTAYKNDATANCLEITTDRGSGFSPNDCQMELLPTMPVETPTQHRIPTPDEGTPIDGRLNPNSQNKLYGFALAHQPPATPDYFESGIKNPGPENVYQLGMVDLDNESLENLEIMKLNDKNLSFGQSSGLSPIKPMNSNFTPNAKDFHRPSLSVDYNQTFGDYNGRLERIQLEHHTTTYEQLEKVGHGETNGRCDVDWHRQLEKDNDQLRRELENLRLQNQLLQEEASVLRFREKNLGNRVQNLEHENGELDIYNRRFLSDIDRLKQQVAQHGHINQNH
jgi:hypothetical protein